MAGPDSASSLDVRQVLRKNLEEVRGIMARSCRAAGRPAGSVALLPVVKYVDARVVRLLHELGVRDAAENTVQGWQAKAAALAGLAGLRWHMIGHLQRNKARRVVEACETIHSLDSERLAAKIEEEIARLEAAEAARPGPFLFAEVNIAGEETKGGIAPDDAAPFLEGLRRHPRVAARVAGLMGMAPFGDGPEAARPHFRRLRELRDRLIADGLLPPDAGLSMGMSGDFAVAIEEGATVVRVGSRLFEGVPGEAGPSPRGGPCR